MTDLRLTERAGLPEALRVLLDELPREVWETHPEFGGLVRFWLERHQGFRTMMAHMARETEGFLDGEREARSFAQGVARVGGMFVNHLHGHHQIEDHHYFPQLRALAPGIGAGFDLLDADHHALDGLLAGFVDRANAAITGAAGPEARNAAGAFALGLTDLERAILRHLDDEEDLIVPVILRHGEAAVG